MSNNIGTLIETYGKSDPHKVWSQIDNLDDLFIANIEFIKGNMSESFYHYGELAPDSIPLIENLVKLHNHGVFTVNGQGPLDKETNKLHIQQKPYLDCFISMKYVNSLIKYLEKLSFDDDSVYFIITTKDKIIIHIPDDFYCVTREKLATCNKWAYPTNLQTIYNHYENTLIFEMYKNTLIYNNIINNYFNLRITTENFNSSISLEKVLLDFYCEKY